MDNPYINPERFGLKIISQYDIAGSYEFDMLVVWEDVNDGTVYYAQDSGCSCPTPFKGCRREDLTPVNYQTRTAFRELIHKYSRGS